MKTRPVGTSSLFLTVALLLVSANPADAQVPTVSMNPGPTFSGGSLYLEAPVSNNGGIGYGPYLRVILDPGLELIAGDSNEGLLLLEEVGQIPPGPASLIDPRTGDAVSGPVGGTFTLVSLAVGSMTDGQLEQMNLIIQIPATAASESTITISATPVHQYGDTPGGNNGPIYGGTQTVILVVARPLEWTWRFATEQGTFLTDGTLGAASSTTAFQIYGFESTISGHSATVTAGPWFQHQFYQGFQWDGSAPTQFFRANGTLTNGSNFSLVGSPSMYTFGLDIDEPIGQFFPNGAGRGGGGVVMSALTLIPEGDPAILRSTFEIGTLGEWSLSQP